MAQATEIFDQGTKAQQRSNEYVRVSVTLAIVLLLLTIDHRFKIHGVRYALVVIAVLLLCFSVPHPGAAKH
jgi:hypothetical protein